MPNVVNLKASGYGLRHLDGEIPLWIHHKAEKDDRGLRLFRLVGWPEMTESQKTRHGESGLVSISVSDELRIPRRCLLVMNEDGYYEMRDVEFVDDFTFSDYALSAREILVSMGYKTRDKPSGHYVAKLEDGTGPIFMGDSFDDVLRQVKDGAPRPANSGPRFMKPNPWE